MTLGDMNSHRREAAGVGWDSAVLAGQITDLTIVRSGGVAGRLLGTVVRVEMGAGEGAVAVGGNRIVVDVVDWSM